MSGWSGWPQVGKLYIHYQLNLEDGEIVELQDVNCLLKDEKELYIQKDHLTAKLDICRSVSPGGTWFLVLRSESEQS